MTRWISQRRWLVLIAAGVLALFLVAACGDDDDDGGDEPTATEEPSETTEFPEAPCEGGSGVLGHTGQPPRSFDLAYLDSAGRVAGMKTRTDLHLVPQLPTGRPLHCQPPPP